MENMKECKKNFEIIFSLVLHYLEKKKIININELERDKE